MFDPSKGVDRTDVAAIERDMQTAAVRLEQTLRTGAAQLHQVAQQAAIRRQALRPVVDQALQALAQAEADLRAS